MSNDNVGELPDHWFADEIARACATRNAHRVAREISRVIRNDNRIMAVIHAALVDPEDPRTCGAGAKHRVRLAVADAMAEYPDDED